MKTTQHINLFQKPSLWGGLVGLSLFLSCQKNEAANIGTLTFEMQCADTLVLANDTLFKIKGVVRATESTLTQIDFTKIEAQTEKTFAPSITIFLDTKEYTFELPNVSPQEKDFSICITAKNDKGVSAKKIIAVHIRAFKPIVPDPNPEQIAFPGADGYGKYATGGRGYPVYIVNSLADTYTQGTLRHAVAQSNRIIIFAVSGTINIYNRLNITGSNLTIAGQTAPPEGITIRNYPVYVQGDNIIIRYLRFRMGDAAKQQDDALQGQNRNNIIIDHCSMSWSTDECASFYGNKNFTMQWCILSESLRISVHDKGTHGYGGIWGGEKASFHHNFLAHHDSRNPRFCGSRYTNRPADERVDFRNNIIYNWGANSGYAGEGGEYNMVNNYYRAGAATSSGSLNRIFQPNGQDPTAGNAQTANVWGKFWLAGNIMHNDATVTANNWLGFQPKETNNAPLPAGGVQSIKLVQAFVVPQKTTHTAEVAFQKVLNYVGASLRRDAIDERITTEAKNGTITYPIGAKGSKNGLIDTQSDVGGWITFDSQTALTDTDQDGMPDMFETANGLNPNSAADAITKTLSTHYTNLEVYINSLVQHIVDEEVKDGM